MVLPTIVSRLKRPFGLADVFILAAVAGIIYGLLHVAQEWEQTLRPTVEIDLSPWALPRYTFFSLTRGFAAYILSFGFTLAYGYLAANSRKAEKVMIPLLDILQSIPVLGFLPTVLLACVALFPHSNIGLEIAAIVMIFTGQVWNMTFSFYSSVRSIPPELREATRMCHLTRWQQFTTLDMPYSALGLIWNSMMSMAGGWFFLMVSEAFVLGDHDFRLPGIGSYMSVAIMHRDIPAMISGIVAMVLMIVVVDQLFWRPIVAWGQRFRFDETSSDDEQSSWVLGVLRESRLIQFLTRRVWHPLLSGITRRVRFTGATQSLNVAVAAPTRHRQILRKILTWAVIVPCLLGVLLGVWQFSILLFDLESREWLLLARNLALTLARVTMAVAMGTLLMVPIGVMIGLRPRLARLLQPVVQVLASFPAPMLFPLVILALSAAGVSIELGAILLMMLGTQWYILFNVIAGASALPHDLREVADVFRFSRKVRWWRLILPAIFPSLVTGWVTAAGGAWNASIVAEYVHFGDRVLTATGLGASITTATEHADYAVLAAGVFLMAGSVVLINRLLWRRLYHIAETTYSTGR